MKKYLILIIWILIGCNELKEKVTDFVFDTSKISYHTNYFYLYESDRLSNKIEKTYTIMFGKAVDSMITKIDFKYNDYGLLVKEISKTDFEDKPTTRIYDYDKNDSLISEISIDQNNDTTFWVIYKYYPDGKKIIFHRTLMLDYNPNQGLNDVIGEEKLDTIFYRNEFEYTGNLCKVQRQFDKQGKLLMTVNYEYNGNKLIREIHFNNSNKLGQIEKTKIYDYSKSDFIPDFISIDAKNDTLEYCINTFDSNKLIKVATMFDYGTMYNELYYKNGLLIGTIDYDKQFSFQKKIYKYNYDDNKLLKSEQSYSEKINAH